MASFACLSADLRGRIASKLAGLVQAPTIRHAGRGHAAIMNPARDEQSESVASRHRHRDRGALQGVAIRLMTDSQPGIRPQLTVVIASPTVGAAFVRQTTAVPLADDQRCEVQPAGNGYRTLATRELRMLCLTGVLRRRAELSAAIESPAVCGAVGRERTGVVDAGADRRELDRRTRRSVGSDGRNATGPGEEDEGRLQRDHVRTPVEDGDTLLRLIRFVRRHQVVTVCFQLFSSYR